MLTSKQQLSKFQYFAECSILVFLSTITKDIQQTPDFLNRYLLGFPVYAKRFAFPVNFHNKLIQITISYSNLQLFKILYIQSDFSFPSMKPRQLFEGFPKILTYIV